MKTFLIVSGVLVVGYVVYSHYNPTVVAQKPPTAIDTALSNLLIKIGLGGRGQVA